MRNRKYFYAIVPDERKGSQICFGVFLTDRTVRKKNPAHRAHRNTQMFCYIHLPSQLFCVFRVIFEKKEFGSQMPQKTQMIC